MKSQALDAIATAIDVHRAAREQVESLIGIRKMARREVDKERNLKATLSRKIGHLHDLEVELKAARSVASAPTVDEIRSVKALITNINNLALADAAREATLTFLGDAVRRADGLRGAVKVT
jgi:hypothetical protein